MPILAPFAPLLRWQCLRGPKLLGCRKGRLSNRELNCRDEWTPVDASLSAGFHAVWVLHVFQRIACVTSLSLIWRLFGLDMASELKERGDIEKRGHSPNPSRDEKLADGSDSSTPSPDAINDATLVFPDGSFRGWLNVFGTWLVMFSTFGYVRPGLSLIFNLFATSTCYT
jgi:hypothetical protein